MKKKLSVIMLGLVLLAPAISTNANCPQGNGGPCTGVCVGIYGSGNTPDSYKCDTGATSAPKDCTESAAQSEFLP